MPTPQSTSSVPEAKRTSTSRKSVDCRKVPSESNCSIKISGRPDELLGMAKHHAITVHGHKDSPELEQAIKAAMEDEMD
jgi:hypothetical protein